MTDEVAADLEQTVSHKFTVVDKQIEADALLLTIERDEVRKEMKAAHGQLLERLRQVVNTRFVSSMAAEEPFASYLRADPLLLQYGGTSIIRLPGNSGSMILSVASTAVRDRSAADQVRMQKVCRNRAIAELLLKKKELQVKYAIETKDQTVVVVWDGKEDAASIESTMETTSAQVEGLVQSLPVVGTWYSRTGEMFFLAVGGIAGRSGNKSPPGKPE
jgi:hypothetical protein